MTSNEHTIEPPRETKLEGLGGWLILLVITLFVGVVSGLNNISEVADVATDSELLARWDATNPGFSSYIQTALVMAVAFLLARIALIVMFFRRHRFFPKAFIAVALLAPIWFIAESVLYQSVSPSEPLFDARKLGGLLGGIVYTVIWVSYMLVSKRVKATFVR